MLTLEEIQKIDSESMYATYDEWPEIAKKSYQKEVSKLDIKDIDHIVFAGMGGSGTISDIFLSIPICVARKFYYEYHHRD